MVIINQPYYASFLFKLRFWKWILLPLSLYGLLWQFLLVSAIYSAIIYKILTRIQPPVEGTFPIPSREFRYYCLRFWVAYYLLYIARAMPLPWVDMLIFPIFGSKAGKNVVLYDSWIDPEFVEIGDSCMLSLNTQIFSGVIVNDSFIVKKVIMEKNTIAGGGAIVAPGTYFEEGAILGAKSRTLIGQRLEGNRIHVGNPVSKSFPNKTQHNSENTTQDKSGNTASNMNNNAIDKLVKERIKIQQNDSIIDKTQEFRKENNDKEILGDDAL